MRFATIFCAVIGLLGAIPPLWGDEGKLQSIRDEVEEPDSAPAPAPPSRGWSLRFGSSSHCDDDGDSLSAKFVFFALTSPWWGPHLSLEGETSGDAEFPVAPYTTHDGYLSINENRAKTDGWGGRLSIDSGNNFHDVSMLSGRLQLDTASRFGIDSEWVWLHERRAGPDDSLHRGDFNLIVRFAQSERAQFHSGIGLNWLTGSGNPDYGFNFTYGADFFPVDPVIISTSLDLGTIGNASLIHFRGTLGLMALDRVHVYSGYDFLNIEGNAIHTLLSGIEIWF